MVRITELPKPREEGIVFTFSVPRTGELEELPNWTLIEDVTNPVGEITVETAVFIKKDEDPLFREAWRSYILAEGIERLVIGERHARALFDQQRKIPEEIHSDLIFPGTVWRDDHGRLLILCLYRRRRRWFLGLDPIDSVYCSSDIFYLRLHK